MNPDKPVRFAPESLIDYNDAGLELCEHIELPNAYHPKRGNSEYSGTVQVHCVECDETFELTELIN